MFTTPLTKTWCSVAMSQNPSAPAKRSTITTRPLPSSSRTSHQRQRTDGKGATKEQQTNALYLHIDREPSDRKFRMTWRMTNHEDEFARCGLHCSRSPGWSWSRTDITRHPGTE